VPDPNILEKLRQRAVLRRQRDAEGPAPHDPTPLTYGYGLRTGRFYVGYSGRGRVAHANQPLSWYARLRDDIDAAKAGEKNVYPCSEAAAHAIAVKRGENLGDLAFASFGSGGESVSPCAVCKSWLKNAYGYYEHDSSWVEEDWR
jgi:hypothetical protein